MSTEQGIKTVVYQNSSWTINANLIGNYDDFMIVEDLTFPEGPDWKDLNAEKIEISSVDVDVKTGYNFTTPVSINQGYITKDFPVYMNFYMGNTATETKQMSWGKYNLAGKSAKGSATTGVKSSYGSQYYKTVLSKKPETGEVITELVANKVNLSGTIDDFNLESEKIILQKGRVVIFIRMADLVVDKDRYLIKGNSPVEGGEGSGSGSGESGEGSGESTAARSRLLVKYLREKSGEKEQPVEAKKESRKGKRSQPTPEPTPVADERQFIEKPVELEDGSKSLILDITFFIGVTFHITYWRKN